MRRLLLPLCIISLFVCLAVFGGKKTLADTSNRWMNGVKGEALPADSVSYDGNTRCTYNDVKSQYVQNVATSGSFVQFRADTLLNEGKTYINQCILTTEEGLFATSGLWSPSGETTTVRPVEVAPYSLFPVSGGGFIVRDGSGPGGFYYSVNKKPLKDSGQLSYKTYGSGFSQKKELIWKVTTSNIAEFYTYADHSLVKFDELAVSNNGDYAVGSINRRGVVKIDLRSGALTPLSNATFSNGIGLFMSISNDGRYAMTTKAGSGKLVVYDSIGCTTTYPTGAWSRYDVFNGTGCVAKDIYTELKAVFTDMTNLSGLHFTNNSAKLEAFIYRTVAGVSQSQRVVIRPQDYSPTAQGYLALGDSFASGEGDTEGAQWYEQGTDEQGNEEAFSGRNLCHLSRRSYPYLLALELGLLTTNSARPDENGLFHSVACSGAKIHNISGILGEKQDEGSAVDFAITDNQYLYDDGFSLEGWQPGYAKQLAYLSERKINDVLKPSFTPEIITMSIGGNDAGFGQKLLACLLPGTCEFASNESSRGEVAKELASERKNLVKVYKKIKEEAPESRIYIIGYPQFVQASPETCGVNVHLDNDEATFINFAVSYYNDVIRSATISAGVTYVDVEDILVNVNLCSGAPQDQMAVNGVTAGNDIALSPVDSGVLRFGLCLVAKCIGSETFHPNQTAQKLYKASILAQTTSLTSQNSVPSVTTVPVPSDYFGVEARAFVDILNNTPQNPQGYAQMQEMVSGALGYRQPTLKLDGMLPSSTVRVEVHSTPVSLGEVPVDAQGIVLYNATLPDNMSAGYHEIHVYGFDEFGNPVHYYEPIMVGASETDFDNDGVENQLDSCPTVANSMLDIDNDGIDDACDAMAIAKIVETTPTDETAEGSTEEVSTEESLNERPAEEEIDKGIPSRETVAGDEPLPEQGAVLGASTSTSNATQDVLSNTGSSIMWGSGVGVTIITSVVYISSRTRRGYYHLKK